MVKSFASIPAELRLLLYTASLYSIFIYWGYLQEKLTSTPYFVAGSTDTLIWHFAFALNFCMAAICSLVAFLVDQAMTALDSQPKPMKDKVIKKISPLLFWRAAATSALASPIGYTSLKYISYPMMILTKASKPVPVILVGVISYNRKYPWFKYMSVFLLVSGISIFTAYKSKSGGSSSNDSSSSNVDDKGLLMLLFGMFLVVLNLSLDGFTNNEQDHIFSNHKATPIEMMQYTNLWQAAYLLATLLITWLIWGSSSELHLALDIIAKCPGVKYDILMFCSCASIGQVLLFALVKEFGSLVWVTISVTRQLFTILISVFVFNHSVNPRQWVGIALVFSGLGLDIVMNYLSTTSTSTSTKGKGLVINSTETEKYKKDDDYTSKGSFSPSSLERGASAGFYKDFSLSSFTVYCILIFSFHLLLSSSPFISHSSSSPI